MDFQVNEELYWINPQGGVVAVFFRSYTGDRAMIELISDKDIVLAKITDLFRDITMANLERDARSTRHIKIVEQVLTGMG